MLKIFGHATSQPTRAVLWLCAMKKLPYELVKVDPMAGGPKQPAFLAKFPVGLIPAIEDGATSICEAHAILQYLATKNKWTDLYPEDVVQRAHVDQASKQSATREKITKTRWSSICTGTIGTRAT